MDFKKGKINGFFTAEMAWGADLSAGGKITYNKPVSGILQNSDLSGWSESNNLGVGPVDFQSGGNSFYPGLSPGDFRDSHTGYDTYGLGYSPAGVPLGFTRNKGYTRIF